MIVLHGWFLCGDQQCIMHGEIMHSVVRVIRSCTWSLTVNPAFPVQRNITSNYGGLSELSDENMRTAIKNSGGVKGTLLIPDAPFELLVRRAIARLLAPSLQCKEFVHSELLRVAAQCVPPDVARFPRLQVRFSPLLIRVVIFPLVTVLDHAG
jgi:hypothetical protein